LEATLLQKYEETEFEIKLETKSKNSDELKIEKLLTIYEPKNYFNILGDTYKKMQA